MRLVRAVLVFTSVIVWSATAAAQVGISIQGLVLDGTLAAVPGATVTATNLATGIARQAVSGEDGRYELAALAPAEAYELRVTQPGFAETRLRLTSLAAGQQRVVDVRMAVAGVAETLDVRPDATLARTPTPAIGGTLSAEQVDSLPVNGRDLINLAYLIPGAAPARGFYNLAPRLTINGSSSLVTNYTIDGFDNTDLFLGGPKVPVTIGATQNLGVLVNSYSSEYGRTGNGVFAVTTRSGAQQHRGGAFYDARPGASLDSPNFFAPRDASGNILDDSFRRNQIGGSIGGPLAARTFYFADVEVTREQQDAILTSPLGAGLAPTSFDSQTLTGKIDRYWNDRQSSSFKYILSDYTHDKDIGFIGGLTLPSAGLVVNYDNQFLHWDHRSSIGSGFNELGVMAGRMRANWQTPDPGPRVAITDRGASLATIGGVSNDFLWTETDLQVRNAYSRNVGRHAVKVGGDLLRAAFDIRSGPGALGSYTVDLAGRTVQPAGDFVTIADLPRDVSVLSYSQSFVNPRVERAQTLLAFFAEDTFRVASTLSVTAGVRWDYDSVTNTPIGDPDLNNIAPRGGFTWTPAFDPRGQIRGGAGLFFERIPFAVFSDTIFNAPQNGALGITFAPGTGFPPPAFPSTLPSNYYEQVPLGQLPPRSVQVFDPLLQTPRNRQLSLGYVRQVTNRLALSADYVNNRGDHLIRRIDTNAPSSVPAGVLRSVAAADATRTVVPAAGGFRLIEQDESTGRSQFHGLYLNARWRSDERVGVDVAYTLSRIENDTDDINFRPVDSGNPDAEWGPSLNDRRHVFALNGHVRLPGAVDLMPIWFLSSGQPLNVTTGTDDNGDTIFNDRPVGFTRNSERTSGYNQLDLGVVRGFALANTRVELRMDVFNLFNTTNYSGFFNFGASGVRPDEAGTLAFQPTVAGPARQFQLGVRIRY